MKHCSSLVAVAIDCQYDILHHLFLKSMLAVLSTQSISGLVQSI